MRYLLDQASYDDMRARKDHTTDCYVRPGEYLHHVYVNGVKCAVARAVIECLKEAIAKRDVEAAQHLQLHKEQMDRLAAHAQQTGNLSGAKMLGQPFPTQEESAIHQNSFVPKPPMRPEETGINRSLLFENILRIIYNLGRPTGQEIARAMGLSNRVAQPLLAEMRSSEEVDIAGQRGIGDTAYEYVLTPRGTRNVEDALRKNAYSGPVPVPFEVYRESVTAQTIKHVVVTRQNIKQAFNDLILTDAALNEIGPAVNSGASVFLFGFPGNGKTSIAERITRLMGDYIFIPYAIEAEGQIIKVYDSIVHELAPEYQSTATDAHGTELAYDMRWVRIKRPTIIVGGELTLPMLDLTYNDYGKFYEAPFQMKANGGIFMIDDFGRQQVRPMDLLNRWIVPLEKRYDYLTTVTGKKLEVPFDELLIFSTNLDPNQLADEAFLRRIKFKIEVKDPDEAQWRKIWELVCRNRKVEYDPKGIDYLIEKWYKPTHRPMRMCQPRDILDQMISISKYNLDQASFTPDLIDAACSTYFISLQQKDFGAKVRLE